MKPGYRVPGPTAIVGEAPERTAEGAAFSRRFGDIYASRDGAWPQAQHVFLGGNGLPQRWAGRRQFVIVETGFGLGTNFLATWEAWRRDPARPRHLHFVSLELHPVPAQAIVAFADPALATLADLLAQVWPPCVSGLHRLSFDDDGVLLTLGFGDANMLLPQLTVGADAFYLDGFAPTRNPLLWQPSVLRALARCARPQATLATWCVAGPVRQGLSDAGFEVHTAPGFGSKREMTMARYAPRWRMRRYEPPLPRERVSSTPAPGAGALHSGTTRASDAATPAPVTGERHAIVIGAGLAGCASALALVRRGWSVTLVDAAAGAACGASRLPAGLIHPEITADDSLLARITRAGHLMTGQALARLEASGAGARVWRRCGVLQVTDDADGLQAVCERLSLPASYARVVSAPQAETLLGMQPRHGGWWFEGGGVVSAERWCRAMLVACGQSLKVRYGLRVEAIFRNGAGDLELRARGNGAGDLQLQARGNSAADLQLRTRLVGDRDLDFPAATGLSAPVVIVASGLESPAMLALAHMPVRPVRGRATLLKEGDLAELKAGLAGDGYAAPSLHGLCRESDTNAESDPHPDPHTNPHTDPHTNPHTDRRPRRRSPWPSGGFDLRDAAAR